MNVSKELMSKIDVILEEEARLGFITEEDRSLVVKLLEAAMVNQSENTKR